MLRGLLIALSLVLATLAPVSAGEGVKGLGPAIPKASGDPHPEGNAWMRRWHMEMMTHDRDLTMYQGVRPVPSSIGGCFDCHTVRNEEGRPITVTDERHFCRTCHDYVAVKIDCFDCHRSTPEGFDEPSPHAALAIPRASPFSRGNPIGELQAYLDTATATEANR